MLVATRISLVMMVAATACATPDAMTGGDDDGSGSENVRLQCSASTWTCPAPSGASKQTVCGQLYDLETGATLVGSTATTCTTPTPSGPCSLAIEVYDAVNLGNGGAVHAPLAHGAIEIDGCGHYRVTDVDVSASGPYLALLVDDATGYGLDGTTVPSAVATPKTAGAATDALEVWIAKQSTTAQWEASGGPPLANGVFVPMFRAHQAGTPNSDPLEAQSGVTLTKAGQESAEDYYFAANAMDRTTIDSTAVETGVNGTALASGASISDLLVYSGVGGIADEASCRWEMRAAMSVPNTVFVQVFRPVNVFGQTCSL
jgi:hypothetical protein